MALKWNKEVAGEYRSDDGRFELERLPDGQWMLVDVETGSTFYSWLKRDCQVEAETWLLEPVDDSDEDEPVDEETERFLAFSRLKARSQVNALRFAAESNDAQVTLLEWAEWDETDWARCFIKEIGEGEYDAYLKEIQAAVDLRKTSRRASPR